MVLVFQIFTAKVDKYSIKYLSQFSLHLPGLKTSPAALNCSIGADDLGIS